MLGLFRKKKEKTGPFVYLSEPTLLYNTKTEKAIVGIIREKLNTDNILVPSKYGMRDTSKYIPKASYFVAIAPLGKFTSLVGREVRIALENGVKVYTLLIAREGDELVYLWVEGVPEDVEWLSPEETMEFTKSFLNSEFMDILKHGLVFGSRKREW
ncbi:hypothetical protein, conserved [Thermococcus kodakarensis KOD1]|uniref:Uncharacterized protein n=1 Tax=Thermococcus kodakarensis (strain ATCC BAA-918 / JCM 12380 / KOD1) TaxID=69014 RepID=Q5JIW8_THEKO|nr:hypothetical protein [Thermococcus kodakarensis]WCN27605.1 hypothetical protein POG15_08570 [Thermococcus kodakarensis]WCN29896.1 hypothetical protein POG21_08555 [Thermococcus kodakarensis]BAD85872.1 hypothetical protein, conserved [Thermococcus kodakarensis KOD1]